jgi:hypothetical protein
MLNGFDWLRRSLSGAEILATLKCLETRPDLLLHEAEIGPPPSALRTPCQRCWIYPRQPTRSGRHPAQYCQGCQAIINTARHLGDLSRESAVIWGFVNRLPDQLGLRRPNSRLLGAFTPDPNHFLVMLRHRELKPFLQELVMYHGDEIKGLLQILPTVGLGRGLHMGDLLCRVAYHEANFSLDRLRVRFYAKPYQVLRPHLLDRKGLLTFDMAEFLSALEMVAVFRTLLQPHEQQMLHELLTHTRDDPAEAQFYWGRVMGLLNTPAKDLLSAWGVRQWSKDSIELLYDLMDYVVYY